MNSVNPLKKRPQAFTLIELLVVIAIIGVLAGMILPVGVHLKIKASTRQAQAQMEQLSTAIESYKAKRSHYPPENPGDPSPEPTTPANLAIRPVPPLYYELTGAEVQAGNYRTTRGAVFTSGQLSAAFGVKGIANSTVPGGNPDEAPKKVNFAQGLDANSVAFIPVAGNSPINVEVLASKIRGPMGTTNLWHYTVGRPNAHNPNSFDLWLDVTLGGHNLRICNWSTKPIKL